MIKCVFFDFDGTIADSIPYWEKAHIADLLRMGIVPPEDLMSKLSYMNFIDSTRFVIEEFGLSDTLEEAAEKRRRTMARYFEEEVPLVKGADAVLKDIYNRGIRIVITTASSEHLLKPCLIRTDVLKYIDDIFS
ncbi:MAG: HAD family phosphatase, partial [Erysipelotrichaceae bacterium]|nr:HAD family phosphatase [Erysipelotrichaceae bacterium]